MKIDKIHPEIIKQYRDDRQIRELNIDKAIALAFRMMGEGEYFNDRFRVLDSKKSRHNISPELLYKIDYFVNLNGVWGCLAVMDYFLNHRHSSYLLSPNFWNDLKQINLKGLRLSDISKKINGYINVPGGIEMPVDDFEHVYVYVGPYEDYKLDRDLILNRPDRGLVETDYTNDIIVVGLISPRTVYYWCDSFPKDRNISVDFFTKNVWSEGLEGPTPVEEMRALLIPLLKILAYIHSGQPDIREFKNELRYRGNSSKVIKKDQDLSQENIHLVGYNWKKAPIYHVDSTRVSGHFRWQRYDKGLSKVKLTWINEHERNFRKPGNDSRSFSAGLI